MAVAVETVAAEEDTAALLAQRRAIPLPIPYEQMAPHIQRLWDAYRVVPGAAFYRKEFGFYSREAWAAQGLPEGTDFAARFGFDPPARYDLAGLGWCEAALVPEFEPAVLEDRGAHEVVLDRVGRKLLCFKNRRNGFMPEYLDHPVKDLASWEKEIRWRMDPASPERYADLDARVDAARAASAQGKMVVQRVVGGYMYLRSLIGPEQVLYAFVDQPELIHACMKTWLDLADAVIARHQQHVTLDEVFFAEDICYNKGPLISPAMIREFLVPYYQELLARVKARQLDARRHLFVQIDTDGNAETVIDLYRETVGMDVMSPFEVASGSDVVKIGARFPWLTILGGIDKRVLAEGPAAIDKHLEYILPAMRARGGFVPTCDHGVPAEVSLANYEYYRKRCIEIGS